MRIKHPLQTLQKSGSLCLTPPPPTTHPGSPSAHTLSSLPWQREEEKQENSIMPWRGRITWGDARAAAPRVKSHVPSSPYAPTTSLPLFTPLSLLLPSLAKDSPQKKKHIKTLLWCHGRQLTPRVQNYRLPGMWHILDGWGVKCSCARSGGCAELGWVGGCIVCLF